MLRSAFCCLTLTLIAGAAAAVPHDPPTVPEFFELIEHDGVYSVPTGMAFAPDGSYFVIDKSGVAHYHDGTSAQAARFLDLRDEVNPFGDRGLLGIAVHPGFLPDGGATSWVYLLYTVSPVFGENWGYDEDDQYSWSRLTRYKAIVSGTDVVADMASRHVLLGNREMDGTVPDGIASLFDIHANGSLRFADDGSLIVSIGDGAHHGDPGGQDVAGFEDFVHPQTSLRGPMPQEQDSGAFRAQDLRSLAGKILRIDPETGFGYPSNPFYNGVPRANQSKVWALGLRNPFRINLKPGTGAQDPALGQPNTIYIGDVGWGTYEELDVCYGGENFGWPCWEGPFENPIYQDFNTGGGPHNVPDCNTNNPGALTGPLLAWNRDDDSLLNPQGFYFDLNGQPQIGFTGSCALGGVFYEGTNYPPEYQGRFFFSDYSYDWVKTIETDAQDDIVAVRDFGSEFVRLVDIRSHPIDTDVYFLLMEDDFLGHVHHMVFDDNQAPVAIADAVPRIGDAPLMVQFDGSQSFDPNPGDVLDFLWDFDDGTPTSSKESPPHIYAAEGVYVAKLTVTDPEGRSSDAELTIAVGETPPTAVIVQPVMGQTFEPDGLVSLQGLGTDFQDLVLDYQWTVDLTHNFHVHPAVFESSSQQDLFVAEDHGTLGDLYFYEVRLSATDSARLAGTDRVFIYPGDRLRDLTGTGLPISHLDVLDPPHPTEDGNTDIEVIRDGVRAVVGSANPGQQFDTRHESGPISDQWIGFEITEPLGLEARFISLEFQEGIHHSEGGWFDDFWVEVRRAGVWEVVSDLAVFPPYPFELADQPSFDGVNFNSYELRFAPAEGDAIRLRGIAGGTSEFVTVAELRPTLVSITPPPGPYENATANGQIIARLFELNPPVSLGRGNRDPETIRNGTYPPAFSESDWGQFDSFHFGDQGDEDWIGYEFASPRGFAQLVFQEGRHSVEGGRFEALDVQVLDQSGGTWTSVQNLVVTPPYPGDPDLAASYETFVLDFDLTVGTAIRIHGDPDGSIGYVSVGELRVFVDPAVGGWQEAYCFCVSGPCANDDPTAGCANSTGAGAVLSVAAGTNEIALDDLELAITGTPANAFGLLFKGTNQISPFFVDGIRCVGAVAGRLPVSQADGAGTFSEGPGIVAYFANSPNPAFRIQAGSTWNFQAWYRDTSGPCSNGSNLTNGVSVVFAP